MPHPPPQGSKLAKNKLSVPPTPSPSGRGLGPRALPQPSTSSSGLAMRKNLNKSFFSDPDHVGLKTPPQPSTSTQLLAKKKKASPTGIWESRQADKSNAAPPRDGCFTISAMWRNFICSVSIKFDYWYFYSYAGLLIKFYRNQNKLGSENDPSLW